MAQLLALVSGGNPLELELARLLGSNRGGMEVQWKELRIENICLAYMERQFRIWSVLLARLVIR